MRDARRTKIDQCRQGSTGRTRKGTRDFRDKGDARQRQSGAHGGRGCGGTAPGIVAEVAHNEAADKGKADVVACQVLRI
jgi:hypothetical protein